jgi:hypothetical protein
MATATKKAPPVTRSNGGPEVAPRSASMEFLIDEDNGGDYHWTLLGRDGTSLARSGNFATYERTEQAARAVLDGMGSARLDPRAAADTSDEPGDSSEGVDGSST